MLVLVIDALTPLGSGERLALAVQFLGLSQYPAIQKHLLAFAEPIVETLSMRQNDRGRLKECPSTRRPLSHGSQSQATRNVQRRQEGRATARPSGLAWTVADGVSACRAKDAHVRPPLYRFSNFT